MGGKRMNGDSRAGYKKRPGAVEIYTYELLACIMPSCFYPVCSYVVTAIVGTCGTPKSKYLLSLLLPIKYQLSRSNDCAKDTAMPKMPLIIRRIDRLYSHDGAFLLTHYAATVGLMCG